MVNREKKETDVGDMKGRLKKTFGFGEMCKFLNR